MFSSKNMYNEDAFINKKAMSNAKLYSHAPTFSLPTQSPV